MAVTTRLRRREGQAMVEFALVLPFLLLLIVGIVQFGIGLHYWLDLTHTANQGARYATVNLTSVCNGAPPTPCAGGTSFATFLANELDTQSLRSSVSVSYCYKEQPGESNGPSRGDPITVRMQRNYNWARIVNLGSINLIGKATMRLEQNPTALSTTAATTPPVIAVCT